MKKTFLFTSIVVLSLFLFGCSNNTSQINEESSIQVQNQEDLVKEAFNNYKSSILNDKGKDAVNYVDTNTIKYYEKVLELVKNADRKEISSLSLLDKLMVVLIRHTISKEDIFSFDGRRLLIYAIENGMVGKDSVMNSSIGKVSIDENFAKGEMLVNGKKNSVYFHFYKESGVWKVDLTSIFDVSNMAFKKMVEKSDQTEDDFIFLIIESSSGKKPNSNIWEPIKK